MAEVQGTGYSRAEATLKGLEIIKGLLQTNFVFRLHCKISLSRRSLHDLLCSSVKMSFLYKKS